jgi:acetyl-CoA carboxylase biotin carboxyl carrier protein
VTTIDVVSEVAGTVWEVIAAVGQSLNEDDGIIIVESMKMEVPVGMPEDGTLTEILVAEKGAVAQGQVVARITIA